jgi:hypothetical protein
MPFAVAKCETTVMLGRRRPGRRDRVGGSPTNRSRRGAAQLTPKTDLVSQAGLILASPSRSERDSDQAEQNEMGSNGRDVRDSYTTVAMIRGSRELSAHHSHPHLVARRGYLDWPTYGARRHAPAARRSPLDTPAPYAQPADLQIRQHPDQRTSELDALGSSRSWL